MATVNALTAKLNNQDINLDDLIGKPPGDQRSDHNDDQNNDRQEIAGRSPEDRQEKIEDWKAAAENMGLKIP